jgi:ankyrin repeat protein
MENCCPLIDKCRNSDNQKEFLILAINRAVNKSVILKMHKIHFSAGLILLILHSAASFQMRAEVYARTGTYRFPPFTAQIAGGVEMSDPGFRLILAAERGDKDSVNALIESGADVNSVTFEGVTPLMYAASNGFLDIVVILVENAAEIDALPHNGITALSGAVLNNHYEIALYLLQNGADTEIDDARGITPLLYAAAYDNFENTELLLMFGANPMHRDLEGATALHAAAIYSQPDIAWLLLDYGADINAMDGYGFTPLAMAVQLGRNEMAGYLVEAGADIHARTDDNIPVLAIAIANNRPELAEKLIALGADPHDRISYSDNLMNLARWTGDEKLISLLRQHGVRSNILPGFRTLRLSYNTLMNSGDFFNGPQASLEDDKFNLLLTAGWYTRPVRRAVIVEYRTDWFDQLWEQRHLFFGSLHKLFPLQYTIGLNPDGFYAGINVMYSRGRYWGTYRYPRPGWHVVPSAGYYKSGSWWFYNIGYEYIQLNILEKSPHRLSFGAGIRFNITREPVIYRTTYW